MYDWIAGVSWNCVSTNPKHRFSEQLLSLSARATVSRLTNWHAFYIEVIL